MNLKEIKKIPIQDVARQLGVTHNGSLKLKCFNSSFHRNGDKTPSLSLNITNNRFKCFSCGESGSPVDLYMGYQNVDLNQAIQELGRVYSEGISCKGIKSKDTEKEYLSAGIKKWKLGDKVYTEHFSYKKYVKVRFRNPSDKSDKQDIYFTRTENEKFIIGRKCPPELFNAAELLQRQNDVICFVEGEPCVNSMKSLGFLSTTTGSATITENTFTPEMVSLVKDREIVVFPDNDEPGKKLVESLTGLLGSSVKSVKTVDIPSVWLKLFKEEMPEKADIKDFIEKYKSVHSDSGLKNEIDKMIAEAKSVEVVEVVEVDSSEQNPTIEDSTIFPEIPFPFEIFPNELNNFISKLSDSLHVPSSLTACCILPIVGGSIGNTLRVSPKQGWSEPSFIWMMILADTGKGKSPVISKLMAPLNDMQIEEYKKHSEALKEYENQTRKAKKNDDIDLPDKPKLKHFKVTEFTIESLVDIFHDDPHGVSIYRDELAGLFFGLNQYKGGKGSDRQQLLELFNCSPLKVDRKNKVTCTENSGASIIGGLQPRVMQEIFDEKSFDDGLIPRFLVSHTEPIARKFSRVSISDNDTKYWKDILEWCYGLQDFYGGREYLQSVTIPFSDKALDVFEKFFNEYEQTAPFLSHKSQVFIPKLITYCLRLTGVLHTLRSYPCRNKFSERIPPETVTDAVKLVKYFAGQMVKSLELYKKQEKPLNEYQERLINVLWELRHEVANGKLLLGKIVSKFNQSLPELLQHTPHKIKSILTADFGLETKRGTGNLSSLIWESVKIKELFQKTNLTNLTNLTDLIEKRESDSRKVTEVNLVKFDSGKNISTSIDLNKDKWELVGDKI